jgi:immunoglobulin-binding protein 1
MSDQNIKSLFQTADQQRKAIESSSLDSSSNEYQSNLVAAIASYQSCLHLVDRLALFSPNETLEDITSGDLQYGFFPPHTSASFPLHLNIPLSLS